MVTILLFPGQGAQKIGMTRDLVERFPAARETLMQIDAALEVPLSRLMWEGPDEDLALTQNTQPAILAHSAAVLSVVKERLGTVAAAAGHSLGEYSAWVASGALDAAAAAKLVRRRGELMYQAGQQRPGTMAAILGLATSAVESACADAVRDGGGTVVAANLNAPDQTVISGDPQAVIRAGERCTASGAKRVQALKVSGAFHSPLMDAAVPGLQQALDEAPFGEPVFPVMANATAEAVTTAAGAVESLAAQLVAPVRWVESMQRLASLHPGARWLEIGPGRVLSGLLRRIVPDATCTALGTAAELDTWLAA